jgi:hypothetical protein
LARLVVVVHLSPLILIASLPLLHRFPPPPLSLVIAHFVRPHPAHSANQSHHYQAIWGAGSTPISFTTPSSPLLIAQSVHHPTSRPKPPGLIFLLPSPYPTSSSSRVRCHCTLRPSPLVYLGSSLSSNLPKMVAPFTRFVSFSCPCHQPAASPLKQRRGRWNAMQWNAMQ